MIENKKWTWAGHTMSRIDSRRTARVTEWQLRNCRSRWRDKINPFARTGWSTQQQGERAQVCLERVLTCSRPVMTEDNYDMPS